MSVGADSREPFLHARAKEYLDLLKELDHPEPVERQISYAIDCYRKRHEVGRDYLSSGGTPGHEARSAKWREADTALWTSVTMLALLIDSHYPSPTGRPPIDQVLKLVQSRTGPLCSGWLNRQGHPMHHINDTTCPVHHRKENTPWY